MSKIYEVVDTTTAYTSTPKDAYGKTLPLGVVKVRTPNDGGDSAKQNAKDEWAVPLGPIKRIPLIGEQVLTLQGPSWSADSAAVKNIAYYLTSCNVQDNLNIGVLPQTFLTGKSNQPSQINNFLNSLGNPQTTTGLNPFLGETFQERSNIKPMQPFEGDTIIEGRWGQTIRLSSTIEASPHPDALAGKKVYALGGSDWEGGVHGPGSPIMFITNGHAPITGKSQYSKESFELDNSTICLTSGQILKTFETGQPNLGLGVPRSNKANSSQIVISSDRLVFNAKKEFLVLVAKKSVQIATPDWAADMNEVLSIIDEFLKVMQKITSGASPYPTSPGVVNGPTAANPAAGEISALVARMLKLKQ